MNPGQAGADEVEYEEYYYDEEDEDDDEEGDEVQEGAWRCGEKALKVEGEIVACFSTGWWGYGSQFRRHSELFLCSFLPKINIGDLQAFINY